MPHVDQSDQNEERNYIAKKWISYIGEEALDNWKHAPIEFVDNGTTLRICGREVMQEWETPLMEEIASVATERGGRVLEVGFGMGISASFIQKSDRITEHVVIEANEQVFERLKEFAKTAKTKVTPILGFWQEIVPTLCDASFDGILFDPYPISQSENMEFNYIFIKECYRLLKKGGILTYYSNEAEDFSDLHLRKIREYGFTDEGIELKTVYVSPPPTCEYWKLNSMISPKLTKL